MLTFPTFPDPACRKVPFFGLNTAVAKTQQGWISLKNRH
jgi:hypothetical protein